MSSRILIITGMHRSGTSLVSHYLSACGLNIGDNLTNSEFSNSNNTYDGHHEDRDFSDFHKLVLKKKHINPFPTNQFRLPVRVGNQERKIAIELIESRADIAEWGWKDPRTTLFLDFWHEVVENPRYLFLFRHPLAVADSLVRRGTDKQIVTNPIIGLKTWRIYNQQLIGFWRKHQDISLVCEIDEIKRDPELFINCLKEKLGIQLRTIPFEKIFLKQGLHTQDLNMTENWKTRYPKEVDNCLSVYKEIQEISAIR